MRISDWSSDVCSSDLLIELARPIIVDLMVVERAGEGARRVRRLQGRIALVLGVAAPVVVDAVDLAADMLANDRHTVCLRTERGRPAFINIIAVMEEQVENRFAGKMGYIIIMTPILKLAPCHADPDAYKESI